jgi:sugar lactone lactonase YvrE
MSEIRVLLDELAFPESPRWHEGRIYVSDWGAGQVHAVWPDGASEVVATGSAFPMCIDFLPDGRLLVVHGTDLLVQDGRKMSVYADLSPVSELGFNDITVDASGNVFVNNVGFEFPGGEPRPGLVAVVTPDGKVREVAGGVMFPNGMVVDGGTLIVAESYANKLTAFEIAPDGSLGEGTTWADLGEHNPDGICLGGDGTVWYADVPHQCCVNVAHGGEVLRTIELDRGGFSCALGDGTLYVATNAWGGPDAIQGKRNGQLVAISLVER